MLQLQKTILECVAKGEPLKATTDFLCLQVERLVPGAVCSILTVDRGGFLHPLSGPSLPADYCNAMNGVMSGPNVGSCGSAAYLRAPVTVTDIENDPRWAKYKEVPLGLGLRACWSFPVLADDGEVLATFAIYYREKRGPGAIELEIADTCLWLCAIALARHFRVEERERRASVDALTGLSNRSSFNAALCQLAFTDIPSWALLMIDVDNLKVVNDTFGHQTGDALLQAVAERIAAAVAPDRAFRLGGDEYAVLVQAPEAVLDLDALASRILQAVSTSALCHGHLMVPRVTIGGAAFAPGENGADRVRQEADFALYHAKEVGRGEFIRYATGMGTSITRRLAAIQDLSDALREGRIEAYYQPVVHSGAREVVGVEALCRIRSLTGEIVAAAAFKSAMSDAHVACELTRRMLAIVSADLRMWLNLGIPFPQIAVNISSADLQTGMLAVQIAEAFGRNKVPLRHLTLEITETVHMGQRDHAVARELRQLRAMGLRIALDDFGTRYGSLTNLMTIPVDVIKIGQSFVDRLSPGYAGFHILGGIIDIARNLGIEIVAEGIERKEQADQLQASGCYLCQGYFFARPMSREHVTEVLLQQQTAGLGGAQAA